MKLERQLQKELKERYNSALKTIKAFKSVNDVLGWWYYKNLLTKKQLKQAQNNELTLKEVKNLLINKLQKEQEKTLQEKTLFFKTYDAMHKFIKKYVHRITILSVERI